MNLQEAIEVLETKKVTVALDLGVHVHCDLESNCPLAVQLRRVIAEAGFTLEQVLAILQSEVVPAPLPYKLPEVDAMLHLSLWGQDVDIDYSKVVTNELEYSLEQKLRDIEYASRSVRNLGISLYQSYLREIRKHREEQHLPQVSYTSKELLQTGCMVSSYDNHYLFLLPSEYNPQYIAKRGIRYKLAQADVEELRRSIYIKYDIAESKFYRVDVLDSSGEKLRHYHGDSRHDCWGDARLPVDWHGSLDFLVGLTRSLANSLTIINHDSILLCYPSLEMPHVNGLLSRSTKLGVEGTPTEDTVLTNGDTVTLDHEFTEHRATEPALRDMVDEVVEEARRATESIHRGWRTAV